MLKVKYFFLSVIDWCFLFQQKKNLFKLNPEQEAQQVGKKSQLEPSRYLEVFFFQILFENDWADWILQNKYIYLFSQFTCLKSDWLLISPHSITLKSNIKVMRMKEIITSLRSSRLLS